jgi:ribosomal protein S19E (S16A)
MKKRAVSTDDLLSMFPNKFSERYYARRAMDMLSKYGYVKALDDKVQITPLGDAYLSKIAKHYVGEFK